MEDDVYTFKDAETLGKMVRGALRQPRGKMGHSRQETIVYCAVGGYASSLWFVLTQVPGYDNVKFLMVQPRNGPDFTTWFRINGTDLEAWDHIQAVTPCPFPKKGKSITRAATCGPGKDGSDLVTKRRKTAPITVPILTRALTRYAARFLRSSRTV